MCTESTQSCSRDSLSVYQSQLHLEAMLKGKVIALFTVQGCRLVGPFTGWWLAGIRCLQCLQCGLLCRSLMGCRLLPG